MHIFTTVQRYNTPTFSPDSPTAVQKSNIKDSGGGKGCDNGHNNRCKAESDKVVCVVNQVLACRDGSDSVVHAMNHILAYSSGSDNVVGTVNGSFASCPGSDNAVAAVKANLASPDGSDIPVTRGEVFWPTVPEAIIFFIQGAISSPNFLTCTRG